MFRQENSTLTDAQIAVLCDIGQSIAFSKEKQEELFRLSWQAQLLVRASQANWMLRHDLFREAPCLGKGSRPWGRPISWVAAIAAKLVVSKRAFENVARIIKR